jgi:hypothetical protein
VASPRVAAIEASRVALVQTLNRGCDPVLLEAREQVVIRRHEAKAVADEEAFTRERGEDLDGRDVVGAGPEDVLFRYRTARNMEHTGVLGTWGAHVFELASGTVTPLSHSRTWFGG